MVGKRVWISVPIGSARLQYDLLVGDVLPPKWKGVVADLEIEWKRPEKGSGIRELVSARMVGDGNGVVAQRVNLDAGADRSPLVSNYAAPANGYEASHADAATAVGAEIGEGIPPHVLYYLKIRSSLPSGPLFGKMYGAIEYRAYEESDVIEFQYVINASSSRAVEMDMARITVPSKKAYERPPQQF